MHLGACDMRVYVLHDSTARKKGFLQRSLYSSPLGEVVSRKKERRIPVCDCVCVQDCVRVFREDGACFFGRDMFLQGPSLKETVKSRFVLLVLCPQKGEVQETCDCVPPCLCCCNRPFFVRWQHRPRVWGIVASGGKKKEVTRLCDNVRSCTKKKKKNCGLLSYRMERINVAHAL